MYFIKYRKADRVSENKSDESFTCASSVIKLLEPFANEQRECFWALYLDIRKRLIREPYLVSLGTLSQTLVHPREVFREAIMLGAAAIIVAHNHPSGDPNPSSDDFAMTDRLYQAGSLLGIELLDHIIFAPENDIYHASYRSLKAMGRFGNNDIGFIDTCFNINSETD